ncbi:MAG: Rrf2 family transcriptional regulator [Syntrophobacteraceae bacterium]|jgi:Rrf2 family protein
MAISQKCQYALRALYELAKNGGPEPMKMAEIARRQAIPLRFLEIILNELKRGGFIRAIRGKDGGCFLSRSPGDLTVGEVMRFVEGSFAPVGCVNEERTNSCPLQGKCVFLPLWERAQIALAQVYDGINFQDLIDQESQRAQNYESCLDYVI